MSNELCPKCGGTHYSIDGPNSSCDGPPLPSPGAWKLANDMIAGTVKSDEWPGNVQQRQQAPRQTTPTTNAPVADVEWVAQFLHDEGGFGDAWTGHTWPEHPDDTGQREGGFVKIVPSDVQALFRDAARRLLISRQTLPVHGEMREALQEVRTCILDGDDIFPCRASRDDAIIEIVTSALSRNALQGDGLAPSQPNDGTKKP